jgi:Arc/MetJ-type ribon-helix-helix transcriptional regulator
MPKQKKKQDVEWRVRVHKAMDMVVDEAVSMDLHTTKSELIKDAVRRYLEEKFPNLVEKLRREETK